MKNLWVAALCIFLTACGSTSFSGASSSPSSSHPAAATTAGNATSQPITSTEVGEISTIVGSLLGNIFTNLILGGFDSGGNNSVAKTFACPNGGTVSFMGQVSVAVSLGYPQTTATMNGGNATVTFTNCQVDSSSGTDFTINGSADVSSVQGTASATISSGTFTAQGSEQTTGDLQITSRSSTTECNLSIANTDSANGSVTLTPLNANGTVSASVTGSVCGTSFNQSYQSQIQI